MKEYVLKSDDFLVSQTDAKGIILFANDDFCKIAGYAIEELVGSKMSKFYSLTHRSESTFQIS